MKRFSKAMLGEILTKRIDALTDEHDLQPLHENGTAQLRGTSADVKRAVGYGEREALAWLLEEFGL